MRINIRLVTATMDNGHNTQIRPNPYKDYMYYAHGQEPFDWMRVTLGSLNLECISPILRVRVSEDPCSFEGQRTALVQGKSGVRAGHYNYKWPVASETERGSNREKNRQTKVTKVTIKTDKQK